MSKKLKITIMVTVIITLLSADSVSDFLSGLQRAMVLLA